MTEQDFLAWLASMGAAADVTPDMTLAEAGIDSLLLLEWAVAIEERTHRTLSDDLLENLRTVRDLHHFHHVLGGDEVPS